MPWSAISNAQKKGEWIESIPLFYTFTYIISDVDLSLPKESLLDYTTRA